MAQEARGKLWNADYLKIWTGNFLIHFSFTLIVPLLPLYLNETFGADKQTIGICLAGYTVMSLIIRPFSGYLVDTFPRRIVLLICNFLFFAVFAGYLVAGSITVFTIFRTLHGLPFGATTVAANTVAIDVLPSDRRTEGIGYYGISNNLAMAIGPALAIYVLQWAGGNFQALFWLSFAVSFLGLILDATIKLPRKETVENKEVLSLDRFFLVNSWREAIATCCLATAYGIISTYVAIYGKQQLGLEGRTGVFFTLFAVGLIVSRLSGARSLRQGRVTRNAITGVIVALCAYILFAFVKEPWAYFTSALILGLGNGHWWPAYQSIFVDLASNHQRGTAVSSILTSWDTGVGIGILLGGILAEQFSYSASFIAATCIDALAVILTLTWAVPHFKRNRVR